MGAEEGVRYLPSPHIEMPRPSFVKPTPPPPQNYARMRKDKEKLLWVLSGCRDHEISKETKHVQKNGAFTWALHTALKKAKYCIRYHDLLRSIQRLLRKDKYNQTPVLSST